MLEEQVQDAQTQSSPKVVFERMIQAANRHDLEAMVACFAPDFRSEQPFFRRCQISRWMFSVKR